MPTDTFFAAMPKVELHVHLEGSIRPETVLKLARKNNDSLPSDTVEGLRDWYQFRDFPHFVEVYVAVSKCIQTPDDLELVVREFLEGQKAQNILHSEITYTASTIEKYAGIPWADQKGALQRGLTYGRDELGLSAGFILDIVRGDSAERGMEVLGWVEDGLGEGVIALGLAGEERLGTALYADVFSAAKERAVPVTVHAGETVGPESIRETLDITHANRIGHGVRVVEDGRLLAELRDRQVHLEVCPGSNVCLGVYPSLAEHPFARLLDEGISISLNSDDPPMFSTSLTEEWVRASAAFDLNEDIAWSLTLNAANAAFLDFDARRKLIGDLRAGFSALTSE